MLVLQRKVGESIVIETSDGDITVTVVEKRKGHMRIGITAPEDINVRRSEIDIPPPRMRQSKA